MSFSADPTYFLNSGYLAGNWVGMLRIIHQDMYSHYGHQLNYEDFMKVLHFGMIGRYEEKLSFNIKENVYPQLFLKNLAEK
jgi:thiamine transporter ThiT